VGARHDRPRPRGIMSDGYPDRDAHANQAGAELTNLRASHLACNQRRERPDSAGVARSLPLMVNRESKHQWRTVMVGGVLAVCLIVAPIVEQAHEHHDEAVMVDYRSAKHDHSHEIRRPRNWQRRRSRALLALRTYGVVRGWSGSTTTVGQRSFATRRRGEGPPRPSFGNLRFCRSGGARHSLVDRTVWGRRRVRRRPPPPARSSR
jgi:hypothetical protein